MARWAERLRGDREALEDLLAWVAKREAEAVDLALDPVSPLETVWQARGTKKVLDELKRCATMLDREEQAYARFRHSG